MADFIYKYAGGDLSSPRFQALYNDKLNIAAYLRVFYNQETITHVKTEEGSITILGYAFHMKVETKSYLTDLLHGFTEKIIPEIKKDLLGQYIAIIHKKNVLYIFSDFLQVRSIYYSAAAKVISSSYDVSNEQAPSPVDLYKGFEYAAMRHCMYPAWLGNSTMNSGLLKLRGFEYLKIECSSGVITVCDFKFTIRNIQEPSLSRITQQTLDTLRTAIRHPQLKEQKIASNITGGFDSRLVTALVKEYYTNVNLRISVYKGETSLDYTIAQKMSKVFSTPLTVYETDKQTQTAWFYSVVEGLAPTENAIITNLLQHTQCYKLGFGGAFGTELYTLPTYTTTEELFADYLRKARQFIQADEPYFERFEQALRDEYNDIKAHYCLAQKDERCWMRIMRMVNTAYFSSPFVSAFNIYGNQFEIFGTFPIIELGLQIPYKYFGSSTTFGRFYLIPKNMMEQVNRKASSMDTNHFCPMRPLSIYSFFAYFAGRFRRKRYYAQMAKKQVNQPFNIKIEDKGGRWTYTSNGWIEAFWIKFLRVNS